MSTLSTPVPEGMSLLSVLAALGMGLRQIFPTSLPTCLQISAQVWLPSLPAALQGMLGALPEFSQALWPHMFPHGPESCHVLQALSTPFTIAGFSVTSGKTVRAVSTAKMLSLSSLASCNRLEETQDISDSGNVP